MAFEQLSFPQPEITIEEKRNISDFVLEEARAVRRIQQPEIERPVRPMYAFIRTFTPELKPLETSPGIDMWEEFRFGAIGEINYPCWKREIDINGAVHTVVVHHVYGELPSGAEYQHHALRCSCSLPDYKSFQDLNDEYQPCPAKDQVIDERIGVFRDFVKDGGELDSQKLSDAMIFLVSLIRKNRLIWPPSDRNDRLMIDPLAKIYGVKPQMVHSTAEVLAQDNIVKLHGTTHPSISLAA